MLDNPAPELTGFLLDRIAEYEEAAMGGRWGRLRVNAWLRRGQASGFIEWANATYGVGGARASRLPYADHPRYERKWKA